MRDDPAATVAELTDAITAIESDRHVVGCSFAGVLDRDDRVVAWPNRPSWEGFPIRAALADNGLDEILFADDGHCAAVGEHVYGAASGVTDFLCITVGTGVGSGLFVDGRSRVAVGRQPNGIGHLRTGLPVECRCGATGCVQAVLTADGMRPASWIDRVAETVADVAVLLNLSLVVLTGGRLLHEPQLAQALMSGLNRELRRADCAVRLSRTPDRSAVAGAYALAAEHAAR